LIQARVNGLAALPFHGNRRVEGWQISGIVSAYSMLFSAAGPNSRAGRITASNPGSTPRQIQFGLKLSF
jgi:hypothetical protein